MNIKALAFLSYLIPLIVFTASWTTDPQHYIIGTAIAPFLFAGSLILIASLSYDPRSATVSRSAPFTSILYGTNICTAYWRLAIISGVCSLFASILIVSILESGILTFIIFILAVIAGATLIIVGTSFAQNTLSSSKFLRNTKEIICPMVDFRK